jgi:NAD(P)-dependent dehydrogenase (short-subunit alcohol dehydrogenase family)
MAEVPGPVLITGCSSGIGRATALRLASGGATVYATARRLDGLDELAAAGCRLLSLDVTDEASMTAVVRAIEDEHGSVGALVNNAGYSQSGAIETVPMEKVRRQFETNVFGLVRLTQLVLPGMRRARRGRIVNISSIGGRMVFPGGGYYHATKYAVEAITDALRFEVADLGIQAILIEPGLIRTHFGETAVGGVDDGDEAYAEFNRGVGEKTRSAYEDGMAARFGGGPEAVAAVIERALRARRPRPRYSVTPSAKIMLAQRAILSDRMWDRVMATQFSRPR